jgi:hypothetical protein
MKETGMLKYDLFPIPNPELLKLEAIIKIDEIIEDMKLKVESSSGQNH